MGDPLNPNNVQVPLLKLSVAGDDIDTFVRLKCNGMWPRRESTVQITVCDCPYPIQYSFVRFKRIIGEETVCHFEGLSDEMENFNEPPVMIPLSHINTWKAAQEITAESVKRLLGMVNPRQVLIRMYNGKWERCFIKRVICESFGPKLVLGRSVNSLFDRVVYLGLLKDLLLLQFVEPVSNPVHVSYPHYHDHVRLLQLPCVVKPEFVRDVGENIHLANKSMTLIAYSQYGSVVRLHFVHNDRMIMRRANELSNLTFVQNL